MGRPPKHIHEDSPEIIADPSEADRLVQELDELIERNPSLVQAIELLIDRVTERLQHANHLEELKAWGRTLASVRGRLAEDIAKLTIGEGIGR